jgi:N-acetylglucosamine malate deacetylase 1
MRILVFAPHNDDEVLGVGGTIAKYARMGHEVFVCEATASRNPELLKINRSEALKAHKVLGVKETIFLDFPPVELVHVPVKELTETLYEVVMKIKPEIAFVPHKGDMHLDHRTLTDAAMVALRPINNPQLKFIYSYETLSETEWNIPSCDYAFVPNAWSDITEDIHTKIKAMECYQLQLKSFPEPRSLEAIEALAKFRGSTVGVKYAESFMTIRAKF